MGSPLQPSSAYIELLTLLSSRRSKKIKNNTDTSKSFKGQVRCGGFGGARVNLTSRVLTDLKVQLKIYGGMFGRGPRRTAWPAEQHHSGTPNKPYAIFHPIFYQ